MARTEDRESEGGGAARSGGYGDTERGSRTAQDTGFEGDPPQERKEELADERAESDDEAEERDD